MDIYSNKEKNRKKLVACCLIGAAAVAIALILAIGLSRCSMTDEAPVAVDADISQVDGLMDDDVVEAGDETALPGIALDEMGSDGGGVNAMPSDAAAQRIQEGGETSAGAAQESAKPSQHPAPETQKRWVEDTERVWVVDKAAWVEQIPTYAATERSICNVCGADITGNTTAHGKAHMLAGEGSGHHSEVHQTISGYNTVNHSEEGHWETRVIGGHWE